VMEAALRYAVEKLDGKPLASVDFKAVRGMSTLKEATVTAAGKEIRVAVVHGLANAKRLINDVRSGKAHYDFVEVMACPGGCISGGGQPVGVTDAIRIQRQQGLYAADKSQQVQKSQDNFLVDQCYKDHIGGQPGSHEAHQLLHTVYQNRSQLFDAKIPIMRGTAPERFMITVTICAKQDNCPGQLLIGMISEYVRSKNYTDKVDMDAAFSSRPEQDGTICVTIGDEVVERTKFRNALNTLEQLQNQAAFETIKKKIDESVAKLG
ncbi:MAG: iron hydrogenase small subunit, partial [Lentisphaeria bacterium]|nr:iron hydrogenase small subunit [Lentisphaeria bacterium]